MQLRVCQPSSKRRSETVVAGCTTAEGSPEAPHSPWTVGVARFWLKKPDGQACLRIRCCVYVLAAAMTMPSRIMTAGSS